MIYERITSMSSTETKYDFKYLAPEEKLFWLEEALSFVWLGMIPKAKGLFVKRLIRDELKIIGIKNCDDFNSKNMKKSIVLKSKVNENNIQNIREILHNLAEIMSNYKHGNFEIEIKGDETISITDACEVVKILWEKFPMSRVNLRIFFDEKYKEKFQLIVRSLE